MKTRERNARTAVQTVAALTVLAFAGVFGLPLAAWMLDGSPSTEFLIVPAHLLLSAVVGAGLARWLPVAARPDVPKRTRLLVGAAWGLLAAIGGLTVFWFLLNGVGGA